MKRDKQTHWGESTHLKGPKSRLKLKRDSTIWTWESSRMLIKRKNELFLMMGCLSVGVVANLWKFWFRSASSVGWFRCFSMAHRLWTPVFLSLSSKPTFDFVVYFTLFFYYLDDMNTCSRLCYHCFLPVFQLLKRWQICFVKDRVFNIYVLISMLANIIYLSLGWFLIFDRRDHWW